MTIIPHNFAGVQISEAATDLILKDGRVFRRVQKNILRSEYVRDY